MIMMTVLKPVVIGQSESRSSGGTDDMDAVFVTTVYVMVHY